MLVLCRMVARRTNFLKAIIFPRLIWVFTHRKLTSYVPRRRKIFTIQDSSKESPQPQISLREESFNTV
ncbi:Uncharacterized protein APZ42_003573 [Daphnia magna]|uniref:Uncharacterized protein n=1 Tax=Daphnia magna TaxID=35525 RepID=A0A162C2D8_9CRUS|nr:Uncharacterized protein APZ42_003573 [Daphnia magna]